MLDRDEDIEQLKDLIRVPLTKTRSRFLHMNQRSVDEIKLTREV